MNVTELTGDQKKVRDIAISLREASRRDPFLSRWKQGLQERFGIGRYITHADIKGGVGNSLTIKLGNVVLNDHLPEGVEFRGYRHVEKDDDRDGYTSKQFHFYDPVRRHIGLTVECDPSAHFQLPIQKTPMAGLIILHEAGHVWDDVQNPGNRVLHIQNAFPTAVLESMDENSIRDWYSKAQEEAEMYGGRPDSELFRKLVEHSLKSQASKVANDLMFNKKDGIARLVPYSQFASITEEVAKKITETILTDRFALSSAEGLAYRVRGVRQIAQLEEEKFFRGFVKEKEEKAWEWAEEERAHLKILDPRISLWDGNENALVLLKTYFVLHHPEVRFRDLPEGELKKLLEDISDVKKVYQW